MINEDFIDKIVTVYMSSGIQIAGVLKSTNENYIEVENPRMFISSQDLMSGYFAPSISQISEKWVSNVNLNINTISFVTPLGEMMVEAYENSLEENQPQQTAVKPKRQVSLRRTPKGKK